MGILDEVGAMLWSLISGLEKSKEAVRLFKGILEDGWLYFLDLKII